VDLKTASIGKFQTHGFTVVVALFVPELELLEI
jgi:hypothetical protein